MLDRTGIDFQLWIFYSLWIFSSVQFNCLVVSDSLWPHELQYPRPLCPSPIPAVYSNSCPSSRWCHPAVSSSVVLFSSCPQSLPASGPFPMSLLHLQWNFWKLSYWSQWHTSFGCFFLILTTFPLPVIHSPLSLIDGISQSFFLDPLLEKKIVWLCKAAEIRKVTES